MFFLFIFGFLFLLSACISFGCHLLSPLTSWMSPGMFSVTSGAVKRQHVDCYAMLALNTCAMCFRFHFFFMTRQNKTSLNPIFSHHVWHHLYLHCLYTFLNETWDFMHTKSAAAAKAGRILPQLGLTLLTWQDPLGFVKAVRFALWFGPWGSLWRLLLSAGDNRRQQHQGGSCGSWEMEWTGNVFFLFFFFYLGWN